MQMNRNLRPVIISAIILVTASCGNDKDRADAYGNFESDEIIISAQSTGDLMMFDIKENTCRKVSWWE